MGARCLSPFLFSNMDRYEQLRRDILSIGAKYSTYGMTMPEFLRAMSIFVGTAVAVDCHYDEQACTMLSDNLKELIDKAWVQAILHKDQGLV